MSVSQAREEKGEKYRGVSLTVTLTTGLGALLAISVTAVLAIGLWSARKNTMNLISVQAQLAITSAIAQIEEHLEPATDQADFIGKILENGAIVSGNEEKFSGLLIGALGTAPQVQGFVFIDREHQLFGARRSKKWAKEDKVDKSENIEIYRFDLSTDRAVREALEGARTRRGVYWAPPVWRKNYQTTLLNLRRPVHRNGQFLGLLVSLISIDELSHFLARLKETLGNNTFILYGRKQVLAHANLVQGSSDLSEAKPLPSLSEVADPILASIWNEKNRQPLAIPLDEGTKGFLLDEFDDRYIFIYRDLLGFGAEPWQIGAYYKSDVISEYIDRLLWSGVAGIGALLVSLLCGFVLARSVARPILRLTSSVSQISKLELSAVSDLPGSRFRELNEQANAFNTMLAGLRWFEVYVPKALVRRLVQQGDRHSVATTQREVTVMFTDIAGFTGLAEGATAEDLAHFLNDHFSMIANAIENTGGTVDKFIGDSVMAFWGAPEIQPDHADRACRAALAISESIQADNHRRQTEGKPPIQIRIGIHSGPVVVGNIGAPGRMNYTIVGDTVNVAQRLEQLGKQILEKDSQVGLLLSGATAAQLQTDIPREPAGSFRVAGRQEQVEVFRLL
jgi:class 3 adenylate cyclase